MEYTNNELYHYGVKGMKWGVRRYRNYDGSYTKAGVKRFDSSLDKYDKADTRYKNAKAEYKKNRRADGSKTELTNARMRRKEAKKKKQLTKDYKHLKQDKLGDQGKELYSKGKTVSSNNSVTSVMSKIGGMAVSAAAYNYQTGSLGNQRVTNFLAGIGAGGLAVAGLKSVVDNSQNKKT